MGLGLASLVSPRAQLLAAGTMAARTRRSACIYVTSCPLLSCRVANFSLLGDGLEGIQRASNSRRWRAQPLSPHISLHSLDRVAQSLSPQISLHITFNDRVPHAYALVAEWFPSGRRCRFVENPYSGRHSEGRVRAKEAAESSLQVAAELAMHRASAASWLAFRRQVLLSLSRPRERHFLLCLHSLMSK